MMRFTGQLILLDIEGTLSPISFVHEVLFPFARRYMAVFLRQLWPHPSMSSIQEDFAKLAGVSSFDEWTGGYGVPPERRLEVLRDEALKLMDVDSKATPLKELQGLIWKTGYEDGTLRSEVFSDVISSFERWTRAGKKLAIYSSGSIAAQKIFFEHVSDETFGELDLTRYLSGYYDTTSGPKREAESYQNVLSSLNLPPGDVLFLSDIVEELNAAQKVGMKTGLMVRPGNAVVTPGHNHLVLCSFDEIETG